MAISNPSNSLYHALEAVDFPMPPDVIDIDIQMHLDSMLTITYKCLLSNDTLQLLQEALAMVVKGQKP